MKTQNRELVFTKQDIIELNDNQSYNVNGGSTVGCGAAAAASTVGCFVATFVMAAAAYYITENDKD